MRWILAILAVVLCGEVARAAETARKPNVIVFLIDDLGERDIGCYGSTFYETPNVDRLATQGVRFTQSYSAACICSPTRAALLTGQSPARLHLTDWIPGERRLKAKLSVPAFHKDLPRETVTLAELFKAAGYKTGSIGKWHLGDEGTSFPQQHGFDVNIAGTHKGQPPSYFAPYKIPTLPDGPAGEYLTDRLAAEAEKYIDANKDQPFFLYLPDFSVHTPIQAKKDLIAKYTAKPNTSPQKNPAYASMVQSTDEYVGRVLKKLDDLKLADDTIVIFTGDNGGLVGNKNNPTGPTSNLPLRAGKGTLYEGGLRVPLVVRYPRRLPAGKTSDAPVITPDLFATILDLASLKPDASRTLDGVSLVPALLASGPLNRDTLYWHYPHYHGGGATPSAAIRKGDWKLIHYFEDSRVELFDLKNDPYEKTDLASQDPARAKELDANLIAWLKATDAQMATPNPNYDPNAEAERGNRKKQQK